MVGSFLIFLREGVEGSMIVAIMCAYLASAGRRDLFRPVFAGAAAALLLSLAAAALLYRIAADAFIDSDAQAWFETATFALAVLVLTYMTFWMKRHARHMGASLAGRVAATATGGSAVALALLAFVTVGREAVEAAIFLLAIAVQGSPPPVLAGAVAGLGTALGLSAAMYRLGVRVNMEAFFAWAGAALMLVAAGLLADAVQNLQRLRVLPGQGQDLWNTASIIPDDSPVGDMLHGLVGYTAAPTGLQAAAWLGFLIVGLTAFLRKGRVRRRGDALASSRRATMRGRAD